MLELHTAGEEGMGRMHRRSSQAGAHDETEEVMMQEENSLLELATASEEGT